MNYKQLIKQQAKILKDITHIPQKEVEILLLYILQENIIWLHLNYDKTCKEDTVNKLERLVQQRSTHYPLEYIIQKVSFYGEVFKIYDGVLIPRTETEILIDKAVEVIGKISNPKIIEVGVGSGIVSIMLALLIKDITIVAVDINDKALELAKQNAIKHKVDHKITFLRSNIFNDIEMTNFDMCISNPPYISNRYCLPKNVEFEPSNALFGGKIGDELLQNIIQETYKNSIKYLVCEMGYDQKEKIKNFIRLFNIEKIEFYKDLNAFDRGFLLKFN